MLVSDLPSGTVTFLFTDIEGSTRLLKQLRERYADVLADHQRILRKTFADHGGREIDTQGDSFFVAFRRAKDAVAAAVAAQSLLAKHRWPGDVELRVRMGIHTGEPTVGEERYVGLGVHRAARICAAGHGGQVLLSQTTRELLRDDPFPDVSLRGLGLHHLKDLDEPEHLYQAVAPGLTDSFPPLKAAGPAPFAGREGELAEAAADEMTSRWRGSRRALVGAVCVAAAALAVAIAVISLQGGGSSTDVSVAANSLGVVDPDSGKLAADIAVGAAPSAVAAGANAIWVANTDDQTVSQIDLAARAVVQTIRVGAGPAAVTARADGVWVVNALDGTLSRIDPRTHSVVQVVQVGTSPTAVSRGLGALWVANGGDSTISKVDVGKGEVVQTLGAPPRPSAIAIGFGSLWVTSEESGTVSRLEPRSGAVARTINVGNGPRAVVVGTDSIWIANSLDGTVSRIDPRTSTVTATIPTGAGASSIAVGRATVWVANEVVATLTRIDAATNRVARTIRLSQPPKGVVLAGSSVLVAVRASGLTHRGGTLLVQSGRRGLKTIDPSLSNESYTFAIPSLTNDGLVAFKRVGGSDGSTLVPDLATSLPTPTDEGKTYTFELRAGIRYSSGRGVEAEDFRRAMERVFRLRSDWAAYYTGIVGARKCVSAPKSCDLSRGIVTNNAARLVTFRLTEPDTDFLYKLVLPAANPVPPGIPEHDVGTRPIPATGPYKISRYTPKRELVFTRNPFFRTWSQAARPAGYPDRIVWRLDVNADAATRAVERGEADIAYDFVPSGLLTEAKTRYASQLHVDPVPGTYFYFFDTRSPPFDDVRARRALNYAIDRAAVIDLSRGAEVASPTCQVLPPNFPGYRPYCPYTTNPSTAGRWSGPDMARARRLVAKSGTKGERVLVWTADKGEGSYVAAVLRRLGYGTELKTVTPFSKYASSEGLFATGAKFNVAALRWFADYPAASGFINKGIFDCFYFCAKDIDREIERADKLQATDPQAANELWARIDRELTDRAPWLFLYSNKQADFVSRRVGNFQYNLQYGVLLDQLWVK